MCTDLYVLWHQACLEVGLCLWLVVAEHETVAVYQFAYLCYVLVMEKYILLRRTTCHILKLHLTGFFLGQKSSSVLADSVIHSTKYPTHENKSKINAKKLFVILTRPIYSLNKKIITAGS